jgi:biotin synthase
LPRHPESVPINALVPIRGTALGDLIAQSASQRIDELEFVRTVAVARLLMPASVIRLSAGRESMSEAAQALCFLAGANSIFYGDKLLTASNPTSNADTALLARLNLEPVRYATISRGSQTASTKWSRRSPSASSASPSLRSTTS